MTSIAFTRKLSLTDVKYGLISTIKSVQQHFPSKGVYFRIVFDSPLPDGTMSFETCLDNLNRIREGHRYIHAFYKTHNLGEGDLIYFEVLEPEQTYRLSAQPPDSVAAEPSADTQPATSRGRSRKSRSAVPAGPTLDRLEATKAAMPLDQFRKIWGELYDQLLAEERARTQTDVSDQELARRARQALQEVHAFLKGEGGAISSEKACDWMQFCYALGLYRETVALFHYVFQDDLPEWAYERARKMAEACRARI
jgi:hypothetical protein